MPLPARRPVVSRIRRSRSQWPRLARGILATSVAALLSHVPARAIPLFWDGSGTGWDSVGSWSTIATGDVPDPSAVPGSADIATFDATSATVAQTVNLNATQSALGLATNASNTFLTTIQGGGANQILNLGGSGISHLGGGLTIGSATAGQQVSISLQGTQTWDNSPTGTGAAGLQILNGVSIGAGGNQTLTLTGAGATTSSGAVSGAITDGAAVLSIAKTGAGTWILSGGNSYTGTTTVGSGGILNIQNNTALGTADGGTTVSNGGALQLQGGITVTGEALTLTGDGTAASTGSLHSISGNNTWTGNITVGSNGTTRVVNDAGTFTLSGNITTSTTAADQFVLQGNGNGVISGNISGNSRVTHSTTGTGTWVLSGTNTYAGTTAISGGTIEFAKRVSLYNGDSSKWLAASGSGPGLAVNSAGTLALNVGGTGEFTDGDVTTLFDATHLGLSTATSGLQSGATFALDTANAAGGLFTLTANLVNPGGNTLKFTKLGANTLELAGTNTYTGATTISAGTLVISGTLGATSLSLASGIVLQLKNAAALNTAALTLSGGLLQLRSDTNNNTFATASTTMNANTTINVDQLTASGTNNTLGLSAMNITFATTGTVTVTGANGYGLGISSVTQTSATGSTLTFANSAPLTLGSFTTNSNATPKLTFTGAGTTTITGNLTQGGTGPLALDRSSTAGTLILQGTSNMTGAVTITNGTIQTAVATNAFGSTSGISMGANGTLALRSDISTAFGNGTTAYPIALTGSGATINVDQATAAGTGQTITLGTVNLPGAFTLNVTGADNTSLTLGQVSGSVNGSTINNSITGGGILKIIAFTQTDAAAHTLTFGGSGNTTVTGPISQNAANALSVTYNGTGKLTLNSANSTYTGITTIANGTLSAVDIAVSGGSSALGNATSAVVLGTAGSTKGTLAYTGIGTTFTRGFTVTSGGGEVDVTGSAGFLLTIASGTVAITSPGTFTSGGVGDTIISSAITGSGGKVAKNDTGALTLAGANTFTGGLTLNGGTLNVNSPTALGSGTFTINGGTLNNTAGGPIVHANTFNKVFNASFTYGDIGSGSNSDLTLGAAASTNSTTITGNIAITVNGSASLFVPAFTLNGGSNTLTKLGGGTLAFGSNSNSDSQSGTLGDTTVSAGTLIFSAGGATPAGYTVGNVSVSQFAVFAIGTGNSGTVVPFSVNGLSGAGTVTTENTFTSGIARRSFIVGNNGASGSFTGNINEGTGADGSLSLSKNGAGTQILSGMDTYTGNTVINAGTLQFGKRISLYNGDITKWVAKSTTILSATQGLYVASGATLAFNVGGTNEFTTGDITTLLNGTHLGASSATAGLQNGSAIGFDTTNAGGTVTYSGAIANLNSGANAIGVTKLGNGTLELAAANTYTGATAVKSGTLLVSGSISGGSAVTVGDAANLNANAVLGGAGTVGNVTVGATAGNTGATINPHAGSSSTGAGTTLNTGALTFADGAAHLSLEIGRTSAYTGSLGTGTADGDVSDHVAAAGAVTLNGADLQLSLLTTTNYAIAQNDVLFLIINGSGSAASGAFASLNGAAASLNEGAVFTFNSQFYEITYQASFAGNSFTGGHDVALLAVPEPSAAAALLGGFALLLGLRRRRTLHP